MSENDYIAEYIKEKRPEIISSFDFFMWKMAKMIAGTVKSIVDAFSGIDLSTVDLSALQQAAEDEDDEEETPDVAAGGEE